MGIWNEDLEAHEDWEFWIRCATASIKMEILNKPDTLALIRRHSTSMTSDSFKMHRTAFKMRISVGPLIKDPALRMINFKRGLEALRLLKQQNKLKLFFELSYTNQSIRVIFVAFHFNQFNFQLFSQTKFIARKVFFTVIF